MSEQPSESQPRESGERAQIPVTDHPAHGERSHTCGALRETDAGTEVVLKGWVDSRRNLGGLIFLDLRDRYGLTQVVVEPDFAPALVDTAQKLRAEDVVSIRGEVRRREQPNADMPTGQIEVYATDLEVLALSDVLPFGVSAREQKGTTAGEELRLKHRYLDLRRPHLQANLALRHRLYQTTRRYFDSHGFLEVETPVLMKSTPEGARDYLVPSRVHPGHFYALPQSPQTYKQLLMVAGLDRYVQITKCFRDEDLRADRQPEFTQIDVEMTFATEEAVYALIEGLVKEVWRQTRGTELETPFLRMPYDEAIRRYGSDKPDLRFEMELADVSDAVRGSGFGVFDTILEGGGAVVGFVAKGEASRGRGQMDKLDKDVARQKLGAGGLFYIKVTGDGAQASVKPNALPQAFVDQMAAQTGAQSGDLVLLLAGPRAKVFEQAGGLRLHVAREMGLIPEGASGPWKFLWVTDFPLLEHDADAGRYYAMHHPFTSPRAADLEKMDESDPTFDPGAVRARAYDLVLNGTELGGGSIRIHRPDVQSRMFRLLGIGKEEAQERFGFLLDAFRYGAPPHGGIALGLDRMVMLLTGAPSLRDVIAFPKTQNAAEPMSGAPGPVDAEQLAELHIELAPEAREEAENAEKTKATARPS